MGILQKAKNKIAILLATVMVAGALPCYMASAEGDAILVFDEEFNGSLTIDSADTTSGISAEKAYSGSSSLKVKGNSWSRSIKGSFDGGLDLGDYVDGGTISFYLFNHLIQFNIRFVCLWPARHNAVGKVVAMITNPILIKNNR